MSAAERDGSAVGIIGAGSWGTALAKLLGASDHPVTLWARDVRRAEKVQASRENDRYLPGHRMPPSVRITADLTEAAHHSMLILAVPTQSLRSIWTRLTPHLRSEHFVLNTSKGLEEDSSLRPSQLLLDDGVLSSDRFALLSGPNHAEEVAAGLPTTTVVAAYDAETAELWQSLMMTSMFRVYTNDDVIGVELAGALKNVIALAAGMVDGLGYGDNTKAALVTRGLAEMTRLGVRMGADPLTFSGLSGMGDLIATCSSRHSRNTRAGRSIGEGRSVSWIAGQSPMVIEGIPTCRAVLKLAHHHGVEMPISAAVADVLFRDVPPIQAVQQLMGRGPKSEIHALYPASD